MKQNPNTHERMIKEGADQLIAKCKKIEAEMDKEMPDLQKLHQKCIKLKKEAERLRMHVTKHTP